MRYYIIAGEASGDLHASNLMRGIRQSDPDAHFRYFGGDLMLEQGGELVKHYRDMAFMGFLEVLMNLNAIKANFKLCKVDMLNYQPDVLILVDYPGFNLRIAKFAKKAGIKVFYYIAPKVWAWKESRVKILQKYVDKLFIIFPFEIEYFSKHGINPIYKGNPTPDAIAQKMVDAVSFDDFVNKNNLSQKPIISLVAGSRKQEIKYNLPVMLSVIDKFPNYQFVIAGAPSLTEDVYKPYLEDKNVSLVFNQTYQLLNVSTIALVTSGTATLEAALLNVPQVVCYKGNFFSMIIAWMVIKVKYISLVNLNLKYEAVRELKQYDLTTENLYKEILKLVPGSKDRQKMINSYNELRKLVGEKGASYRVGEAIVNFIKK
ncbi:MAG: lipid-A-disaccharide synthase [Bacteroidales bacterium]|nr:lipid-A-disaccharide synthase [Bacteroidales bacterium]